MKKQYLPLLLVFLLAFSAKAQIKNPKLHIDVLTSESQTLYTGFDNEIKINADGYKAGDLMISVSQGYLSPKKEGVYVLKLMSVQAPQVVITINKKTKGKPKLLGEETLVLRNLPKTAKFEKGKIKDAGTK